jgi:hypothetical protein
MWLTAEAATFYARVMTNLREFGKIQEISGKFRNIQNNSKKLGFGDNIWATSVSLLIEGLFLPSRPNRTSQLSEKKQEGGAI